MTGITNAGVGGGGGSTFLAYLQIATDPNAVITAVNLAGDTFSGTADSTGSLVMDITEPGTFTVTETDGGSESIVISDNGQTYEVVVVAFNGTMISNGNPEIEFESIPYTAAGYSAVAPTVYTQYPYEGYTTVYLSNASARLGIYKTTDVLDVSEYSQIRITGAVGTGATIIVAIDENDVVTEIAQWTNTNIAFTHSIGITSLDRTKKYSFGLRVGHPSTSSKCYVRAFELA